MNPKTEPQGRSRPPDAVRPAWPAVAEAPPPSGLEPRNDDAMERAPTHRRLPGPVDSNAVIPPCVAVVMAAYNEQATVCEIAQLVLQQAPVQELIIVDDASNDGTSLRLEGLRDSRLRLLRQDRNFRQGGGAAPGHCPGAGTLHCRPGRRPRVRSVRILPAVEADLGGIAQTWFSARASRRWRASCPLFLAFRRQPVLTTLSNMAPT